MIYQLNGQSIFEDSSNNTGFVIKEVVISQAWHQSWRSGARIGAGVHNGGGRVSMAERARGDTLITTTGPQHNRMTRQADKARDHPIMGSTASRVRGQQPMGSRDQLVGCADSGQARSCIFNEATSDQGTLFWRVFNRVLKATGTGQKARRLC
jgi:hypothetical protein